MEQEIDPVQLRTLQVIAGAMGAGVALLSGVIVFLYFKNQRQVTPEALRSLNHLTAMAMGTTVTAIVASELLWKSVLKQGPGSVTSAFIARSACREGAALLGCVTALIGAMNGVLRAYPAYWVNMAPAVLFWSYLYLHWPSGENLKNELSQAV
jgi:hypothetical protein